MSRSWFVFLVLASARAHAQPAAASADADALFDQGRDLMRAGKLAEACSAFDASQKIGPATSTVFNQADCREQNKQFATAYGLFRDAERQTRAPLDEATQGLNRLARDRAKALESRMSKLTIEVPSPMRVPGLEVLRNGVVLEPLTWGRPLPVDGGEYTITARALGHEPTTATIRVDVERDFKTITLESLEETEQPVGTAASTRASSRLVAYVVGGSAVVLIGGALGLDLWGRSQYADAKIEPDDIRQESLWEGAKAKRYVAQGLAVAGLAAAGVAVYLHIRGRQEGLAIAPAVDADSAGVLLQGGF